MSASDSTSDALVVAVEAEDIASAVNAPRTARTHSRRAFVAEILLKHHPKDRAAALAIALTEGRWTHDFPITIEAARRLGIPVSVNMPPIIYELMDLYPQGSAGRPSVLYIPIRRDRGSPREPTASPPAHAPEEK